MGELSKARTEAIAKVYEEIARTGSPTEAQMKFLAMMKREDNELSPENIKGFLEGSPQLTDMLVSKVLGGKA